MDSKKALKTESFSVLNFFFPLKSPTVKMGLWGKMKMEKSNIKFYWMKWDLTWAEKNTLHLKEEKALERENKFFCGKKKTKTLGISWEQVTQVKKLGKHSLLIQNFFLEVHWDALTTANWWRQLKICRSLNKKLCKSWNCNILNAL